MTIPAHTRRTTRSSSHRQRAGLSLMETMLATAILLGSVVALSQLASIGLMHSQRAERITQAQILCQNKMSEIASGMSQAQSMIDEPLPSNPDWIHSVDIQPTVWDKVVSVEVSVREAPPTDGPVVVQRNVGADQKSERPAFTLVRWLPAKSIRYEGQQPPQEEDGFFRESYANETQPNAFSGSRSRGARP